MKKGSFYVRVVGKDGLEYLHVDGFRFSWNGHWYGLWHKERSAWIVIDIRSGMSVIKIPNRRTLQEHLTDELAQKLQDAYKKEFYQKVCDELCMKMYGGKWHDEDN